MKVWSIVVIQGEMEWTAFITDGCKGMWVRFWVSLPVPEVGQVTLPLASKALGLMGSLTPSKPGSLTLCLQDLLLQGKTKHFIIIIIENSYYYININCY
jgi:hypothetical protein